MCSLDLSAGTSIGGLGLGLLLGLVLALLQHASTAKHVHLVTTIDLRLAVSE